MYTFIIILVTIIWGSTFFIIKDTVTEVNEYFIVFVRTFLAALIMFFVVFYKNKNALLNKNTIYQGTIIGFLLAITYISQTIGLKYTSSGHSAFITSSAVIMVPVFLFVFYKQRINFLGILSFVIVFFGLLFLTYDFQTKINVGDIITSVTAISLAFHIILSGRFVKKTDVSGLVFYQFLSASIISLVGFLLSNDYSLNLNTKAITSLLYLGFLGTLFCYFALVWVLKYVNVLKVAIIFSLEPVFAALIAYFAVQEILNFREISGAMLILIGIIFYQIQKKFNFNI